MCKRDKLSQLCFIYAFLSETTKRPLYCPIICRGGVGQMLIVGPRTIGPRQLGPRAQLSALKKLKIGPQGPTVCPEKVANWAPDSWAPQIYYSKIIKKQTEHQTYNQRCYQISFLFPLD